MKLVTQIYGRLQHPIVYLYQSKKKLHEFVWQANNVHIRQAQQLNSQLLYQFLKMITKITRKQYLYCVKSL